MTEPSGYRFDPLERSVFLGLGLAQCGLLGVAMLAAAVARTAGLGLAAAGLPVAVAALFCLLPTPNRPLIGWLTVAAGWVRRRTRTGVWLARLPLLPGPDGAATELPPCLAGLDIVAVPGDAARPPVGLVHDPEANTMSGLMRVQGVGLLLLAGPDQDRVLADWGRVLAEAAAGHGIAHLSWSAWAGPSSLAAHRDWLAARAGDGDEGEPVGYRDLLAEAASVAELHEMVVTVTVAADGPTRPTRGGAERLVHAARLGVDAVVRALRGAGLDVTGPLAPDAVARLVRRRVAPHADDHIPVTGRLAERVAAAGGWLPLAVDRRAWTQVAVDGTLHRTYWVEGWPDQPRPADWLTALLAPLDTGAGIPRAMTVYFVPEDPARSARRVERELTKHETDADSRQRADRRNTAFHRRAHQAVLERGEELAAGYRSLRYLGLVAVSAATVAELDDRCRDVEQLARSHGLAMRALHGRHDRAWAATLPLGLAPRAQLGS